MTGGIPRSQWADAAVLYLAVAMIDVDEEATSTQNGSRRVWI
jgi:hypothetical protein